MSLYEEPIESPFPELDVELSGISLRETCYEILVAASGDIAVSVPTKRPRLKARMTSRLKKAVLCAKIEEVRKDSGISEQKKIEKKVRYQMLISEQSDDRIRQALTKAATRQGDKPVVAMVIPLELLLNITPSQFTDQFEYQQWRLRQLRVLTAGLVYHSANADDDEDDSLSDRLQMLLVGLAGNSVETGVENEVWSSLRIDAMAKAGRGQDGESPQGAIHWADGFPMNVHLYETLLSSCFSTSDEAVLIDEFDKVLEWIKKTWGILGVNKMLHSTCFMWVLFNQFVKTGANHAELLVAAEEQMKGAAAELRVTVNEDYAKSFRTAIAAIQDWAQKRLMQYREAYPLGAQGTMAALLSLKLTAARIIAEETQRISPGTIKKSGAILESSQVAKYIRSSMRVAFSKLVSAAGDTRMALQTGERPRPALAVLAEDVATLAKEERTDYSPLLQQWHLTPAAVAAAALHSCFGKELERFTAGLTGISPDAVQVLQAADQLEMDLVRIAVEDGVADDSGKSLVRKMPPYEAQSVIDTMSKKWVEEGVERLAQLVDRNVQNEQWKPEAVRDGYAPSAVEVVRIVLESLDVFFSLPISKQQQYVKRVVWSLDQGVRRYCQATLAGCGKKEKYVPSLPALTRYNKMAFTSKGGWRSMLQLHRGKVSSSNSSRSLGQDSELQHLFVRINTLNRMSAELQYIGKRLMYGWLQDVSADAGSITHDWGDRPTTNDGMESGNFREARAELEHGVQLLIDHASYRVVFYDLQSVFWEGLYAGGVENSRISQVIGQVDPLLGIIGETVAQQLRNQVVAALMKACFDCFVMVLLAGGPTRAFGIYDAHVLEDDLTQLKDLFTANGQGLPENAAGTLQNVLRLFHMSTEKLIENLQACYSEAELGVSSRFSRAAPLPRTTRDWSPSDANTILRVLCYRADDTASQYLKRTFNLPKRLSLSQ